MAAVNIKALILSSFKRGSTIDQLAITYMSQIRKDSKNKMLKREARLEVEKIILEDYLKDMKEIKDEMLQA